jgi:hypothetical protein
MPTVDKVLSWLARGRKKPAPEATLYKRALAMCDRFGFPYDVDLDVNSTGSPSRWNGKVEALKRLKSHDICHELAHWLVADPNRRHLPNYGLGAGFDDFLRDRPEMPMDERNAEESRASLLGIALAKMLGDDPHWLLEDHSWGDYWSESGWVWEGTDHQEVAGCLLGKGLIPPDYVTAKPWLRVWSTEKAVAPCT